MESDLVIDLAKFGGSAAQNDIYIIKKELSKIFNYAKNHLLENSD